MILANQGSVNSQYVNRQLTSSKSPGLTVGPPDVTVNAWRRRTHDIENTLSPFTHFIWSGLLEILNSWAPLLYNEKDDSSGRGLIFSVPTKIKLHYKLKQNCRNEFDNSLCTSCFFIFRSLNKFVKSTWHNSGTNRN